MTNDEKLPLLLGEIQQCVNTAATFVNCCDKIRLSEKVIALFTKCINTVSFRLKYWKRPYEENYAFAH